MPRVSAADMNANPPAAQPPRSTANQPQPAATCRGNLEIGARPPADREENRATLSRTRRHPLALTRAQSLHPGHRH
jgi:hypothetical protein